MLFSSKGSLLAVILTGLLMPVVGHASAADDLRQVLNAIDRYSARFEQQTADVYGDTHLHFSGEFYLEKPGKFYWRQKKPDEIIYMSNGDLYWHYDALLEQVIIKNAGQALENSPIEWLLSAPEAWIDRFDISIEQGNQACMAQQCYVLTPIEDSPYFAFASIGFNKDKIAQVSFVDNLEQTTHIYFSGYEHTQQPPNGYTLSLPENTEVLDLT